MRRISGFAAALAAIMSILLGAGPSGASYRAFNVTDFGARCDGNIAHDDTAAIQAAISAAEQIAANTNGQLHPVGQAGVVLFPAGQTCMYNNLTINQAVVLESTGTKQAFLRQITSPSQNGILINTSWGAEYASIVISLVVYGGHDPQPPYPPAEVQINNMTIVGPGTTDGNADVGVAMITAADNPTTDQWAAFHNLTVTQFANDDMYVNGNTIVTGYHVNLWSAGTTGTGTGASCLDFDTANNANRFYGLVTYNCHRGIRFYASQGIAIHGLTTQNNDYGVFVEGTPNGGSGPASRAAMIFLDDVQAPNNNTANFYFDQQGGTEVVDLRNVRMGRYTGNADTANDIEIGPDGTNLMLHAEAIHFDDLTLASPAIAGPIYNIKFDSATCGCTVAVEGTVNQKIPQIVTNQPSLVTGATALIGAPPVVDGNPMNGAPCWGNGIVVPQGRLTLTQSTPVMTADVSGATTVYYTDMVGQHVPIFNGQNLVAQNVHNYNLQTTGDTTSACETGGNYICNLGDTNGIGAALAESATIAVHGPNFAANTHVTSLSGTTATISQPVTTDSAGTQVILSATTGDLQLPLDSNTADTGYQASGNLFDLYVTLNPGDFVPTLCTGPQWQNSSPGSSKRASSPSGAAWTVPFMGLWVNSNQMNCRYGNTALAYFLCPPNQCTYVGTLYATANGQASVIMNPAAGTGGSIGACLCLYNGYNQVDSASTSMDTSTTYSYNSTTWRSSNGSTWSAPPFTAASNAVGFVDGLAQIAPRALFTEIMESTANILQAIGIDFNSHTATPVTQSGNANANYTSVSVNAQTAPVLGFNYVQAMEKGSASSTKFGGGAGYEALTLHVQN